MEFDEFPPVDAAARRTSVFSETTGLLVGPIAELVDDCVCRMCGRSFARTARLGRRPTRCPTCRPVHLSAAKAARSRAYYQLHKDRWRDVYNTRRASRRAAA